MDGYGNRYISPQNMFARVQANLDRRTEEIERGNRAMLGIYDASKNTYDFVRNYQLYKAGAMKSGVASSFKDFVLGSKSDVGKYVEAGQKLASSLKIGKATSAERCI